MASAWGVTTNSKNIEFTYNWAIENFDFNMAAVEDKIESPRFTIPRVKGEFSLVVAKKMCWGVMPTKIKIGSNQFDTKYFFSVAVQSSVADERFIGELEVIKDGVETQRGNLRAGNNYFESVVDVQYLSSNGAWYNANGFYTTGSTSLLKLVAKITVHGKMANLGGTADEAEEIRQNGLLDFKPLLSAPKHSDIVLKCDGTEFHCHKVILVSRSAVFDRMLDQNMVEAEKGEVNIVDVEPDTLKQMLEFVYTGQVQEEDYTPELLYAADKYELSDLVKLCARKFRSKITPETAADILLLADRHGLTALKQETMAKIIAEKARYLENPDFKNKMTISLLTEMLAL